MKEEIVVFLFVLTEALHLIRVYMGKQTVRLSEEPCVLSAYLSHQRYLSVFFLSTQHRSSIAEVPHST